MHFRLAFAVASTEIPPVHTLHSLCDGNWYLIFHCLALFLFREHLGLLDSPSDEDIRDVVSDSFYMVSSTKPFVKFIKVSKTCMRKVKERI